MEASNLFLKHQRKQQTKKEELLERGHFLAKWKIILSSKKNEASLSFLNLSTNIEKTHFFAYKFMVLLLLIDLENGMFGEKYSLVATPRVERIAHTNCSKI